MSDKKIPTVADVLEACQKAREFILSADLCLEATIDDYPIGRRDRGKCRLQVEHARGKGYRTVRTTTDKNGRWCTPKKSTFRNACTVVVRNLDTEHQHGWLCIADTSVYVQYANGDTVKLAEAPCWSEPRRADETVTYRITALSDGREERSSTSSRPIRPSCATPGTPGSSTAISSACCSPASGIAAVSRRDR